MKYELVIFDASGTLYDLKTEEVFETFFKLLPELKKQGMKIAVATNLGKKSAEKFIEDSGLDQWIDHLACADDAAFKPAPDMLELIMEEAWIQPENTIMIGDSLADMQAAESAGIDHCLATWAGGQNLDGFVPSMHAEEIEQLWRLLGVAN